MSFGGLLGSLYGDLPPPKTGPATIDGTFLKKSTPSDPPIIQATNLEQAPVTEKPESDQQIDSTPDGVKPAQAASVITSGQTKLSLDATVSLLPPAARRRARPLQSIDRPKFIPTEVYKVQKVQTIEPHAIRTAGLAEKSNTLTLLPQSVEDEYDPSQPNNYDKYIKQRAKERRRQEEATIEKRKEEQLRESQRQSYTTHIAPTASLEISGDEAWQRRRQMSATLFGVTPSATPVETSAPKAIPEESTVKPVQSSTKKKTGFAQKILEKLGWKEGEGLGRDKQGMVAPLVARKTDKRSGVILVGNKSQGRTEKSPANTNVNLENATRILLLSNLVGKGEIDDDLESETAEEGAKYGNLLNIKIIEVPNAADHESVRIFCEYETVENAANAFSHFNNRLFGGRRVKAQFYNEDLYKRNMLKSACA